ncbi:C2 domain-containing protein [Aureococcus anophagefferens]|nr:C2 domain-containing protein [Aureococcus anophagefferens]
MAADASSSAALAAAAPKADDASTSTSATKRKAYNVLNLVLHAGRDLLVMDTKLMGKGSSDPQVKLAFALMDGPDGETLEVEVEDWDLLSSNDFMGRCYVPLRDLGADPTRAWYALGSAKPGAPVDKPRGEVELELSLGYNPDFDYFPEEDRHPGMEPNLLRIGVTRGRRLLPMDVQASKLLKGATTSDPRATISVACKTFKTICVKKSLDPSWHGRFEAHVEGAGHALLEPMRDKKRHRAWYALTNKSGAKDKDRGEVEVVLRWAFEEALERFVEEGFDEHGDECLAEPNELCVGLVQGRDLLPMDSTLLGKATTADPFVKVRLAGTADRFQVCRHVPKTLRPWWNAEFRVPLPLAAAMADGASLELVVEDYDMLSKNDFMGKALIPLAGLEDKKTRRARGDKDGVVAGDDDGGGTTPSKLERTKSAGKGGLMSRLVGVSASAAVDRGEVDVVLRYVRNSALDHFDAENAHTNPGKQPNELRVALTMARGLVGVDSHLFAVPTSDPFVSLACGSLKRKSRVKKSTLDPTWNQYFSFKVPGEDEPPFDEPGAPSTIPDRLDLVVEDWDRFSSPDFMGQVEVALQWVYTPACDFCGDAPDDGTARPLGAAPGAAARKPNLLRVAILSGQGLRPMDRTGLFGGGGSADPVAKLACAGQTASTATRAATLAPEWHETFELPVEPDPGNQQLALVLVVEDVDKLSQNDFMGQCALKLRQLADGGRRRGWLKLLDRDFEAENDGEAPRGEVEVVAKWEYDASLDHFPDFDRWPDRRPNALRVAVIQGRELTQPRGVTGKGDRLHKDAHVSVRVADQVAFTRAAQDFPRPDQPWWNDELKLPVERPNKGMEVEVTVWSGRKAVATHVSKIWKHSDKARRREWLDLEHKGKPAGALDVVVRWEFDAICDFGLHATDAGAEDTQEPNEIGFGAVQVRERRSNISSAPLFRKEDGASWRVTLKAGPRLTATTHARKPAEGAAFFFGDTSVFPLPRDGVKKLDVVVERVPAPSGALKKPGRPQAIASGTVELDLGHYKPRERKFVALEPPRRSRALSRVSVRRSTFRGGAGGDADLEVEVAAWIGFNPGRTAAQGRLERELDAARDRAVVFEWYSATTGLGAVVLLEVPRSRSAPRRSTRASASAPRRPGPPPSAPPRAPAPRPRPGLFPVGATLRKSPVMRFGGTNAVVSCDLLGRAVARVEAVLSPKTVRVDLFSDPGRWAGVDAAPRRRRQRRLGAGARMGREAAALAALSDAELRTAATRPRVIECALLELLATPAPDGAAAWTLSGANAILGVLAAGDAVSFKLPDRSVQVGTISRVHKDGNGAGGKKRRRPLPVRGGEWHERYVVRRDDGTVEILARARVPRPYFEESSCFA